MTRNSAQRGVDLIFGQGLLTAEAVADELRTRLANRLTQHLHTLTPDQLLLLARETLQQFEPILGDTLADTQLAAWVHGLEVITSQTPRRVLEMLMAAKPAATDTAGIMVPPFYLPTSLVPAPPKESTTFPALESALDRLIDKGIVTKDVYEYVDANVKQHSFTVAGLATEDSINRVRIALMEQIHSGGTLKDFRKQVEAALGSSQLGPRHLETVFRTNVQAAFADGQETMHQHPIVRYVLPYARYTAIHDGRVRDNHLALETLGLSGTGIYRADDPMWRYFTPPWDFNSVPPGELVTTSRGYIPIEQVLVGDIVLTHTGKWRPVIGVHCAKGPSELVLIKTHEGGAVRLTAEHRVFTEYGWINAADLHVGQKVYQVANLPILDAIHRKVHEASKSRLTTNMLVPVPVGPDLSPLDLNTNAYCWNKEVEKVRRHWTIEDVLHPAGRQRLGYDTLPPGHGHFGVDVSEWIGQVRTLTGGGHFRAHIRSGSGAMNGVLGTDGGFTFGMPLVMFDSGVSYSSSPDFAFSKNSARSAKMNSRSYEQITEAGVSSRVGTDKRVNASRPVRVDSVYGSVAVGGGSIWLLSHNPLPMNAVRVASVQRQLYAGMVYDVSVADDESFVVGGIAISNCRCAKTFMTVKQAAKAGVREAVLWDRSGEPPEQPEWRLDEIPFRPANGFVGPGMAQAA